MASSDDESELSQVPTIITNPFSIAARKPVQNQNTRNAATRRAVVPPKIPAQKKRPSQVPTPRDPDDH